MLYLHKISIPVLTDLNVEQFADQDQLVTTKPIHDLAVKAKQKLENVAINDVLPLKAARRDAIANLKCFWGLGHQRPNFDGYIYIHYAASPYLARIIAIYFLPFGNVWLGSVSVCNAWEAQCRIYEGWLRTLILF